MRLATHLPRLNHRTAILLLRSAPGPLLRARKTTFAVTGVCCGLGPCAAAGLEVDVVEEAGRAVGGGEVVVSGTPGRPGGGGICVSLTWISRPPSCLRCLCPLDRLVSPCTQARVSPLVLAVHRALYCRRPHFDRFSLSPCSVACRFHIWCWAYPPPGLVPFSLVVEASPLLPC